jgi:hypothetical protein
VVAALAIVAALAGTAVAADTGATSNKITKSKVKKIAKKQANKVLDQRESSLRVDHAKTAEQATNADTAATANAISGLTFRNISYNSNSTAPTTILDLNGFQMVADCDAANQLVAQTTVNAASARYFQVESDTGPPANLVSEEDETFNVGDQLSLVQGGTNDEEALGVYTRPDGGHVEWQLDYDGAATTTCTFNGHANAG